MQMTHYIYGILFMFIICSSEIMSIKGEFVHPFAALRASTLVGRLEHCGEDLTVATRALVVLDY